MATIKEFLIDWSYHEMHSTSNFSFLLIFFHPEAIATCVIVIWH